MQIKSTLTSLLFFLALKLSAQVPQALNYQAIARNADGTIISAQNIGIRFTILEGSPSGTVIYKETHQATTNNFGLFTLSIGQGNPSNGPFNAIDWGTIAPKFLKVEIDAQGGVNYTLQGTTQFLSVPYALYAEKTKLVAGNGITITNGNTISAASSSPAWLLNGNSGTTSSNFIGTIDNAGLNFRTNNITHMQLRGTTNAFGANISGLDLSSEATVATEPIQLSVFGQDIAGAAMPALFVSYITGRAWGISGGNTLGRLARFTQMSSTFAQSHYYDLGISQDSSLYFTNHGFQTSTGLMPKKMITISPADRVGINLNMSESPTAVFHVKGSVRLQGLGGDNTQSKVLVTDINGNVFTRDVSTIGGGGGGFWDADATGIHNNNATKNVAVGGNSNTNARFNVLGDGTTPYTVQINSTNTWQTALNLYNNSSNWRWSMVTGGTANNEPTYGVGQGNFGLANDNTTSNNSTFPLLITADDKVGIGMGLGGSNNVPKTQLHVKRGDIYIEEIGSGVIMKSPNGQCWRMTVSNTGTPVFTSIPCP